MVEERLELREALLFRAELDERLLHVVPEVDSARDLEGEPAGPRLQVVDLDARRVDHALESLHSPRDLIVLRIAAGLVRQRVDEGRREGASLGELVDPETLAPLDHDVESAVVVALKHLDDRSPGPDRPHAGVVGEHEPKLAVTLEAFADQLAVARLEDVERTLLARDEHEVERKEADFHRDSVDGPRLADGTKLHPMSDRLFRGAISELVPYEPGKPVEEVQRELGLERVVKLASNEGQFGPFPAALEALERGARELNRYPDGGAYQLREALAAKHGVRADQIALAAGADGVIGYLSLAALDPGDEVVCGWPSFPSYVLGAVKMGAVARRIPLVDHVYEPAALLDAVTERTKIVYLCNPNNPTGTMVGRDVVDAFFERVPEHVLTVLDEAYFEYVDDPAYPDGIEEYLKRDGRHVLVLRTFSKIYGLAGLRVGYGVGPPDVIAGIAKVRNAFDINQAAQDAALASLGDHSEIGRRRAVTAAGRAQLEGACRALGVEVAAPAVGNFVFVDVGEETRPLFDALLREGVIVRPLAAFGAPTAIRVTVGTEEENAVLAEAFGRVRERTSQPIG